ncbi:MAG: hypothetical protein AAFR79_21560, partial [Pseudomonadota bacterium]
ALLEGISTPDGPSFATVSLYLNPAEVDAPVAVEIGDLDPDNPGNEIAFASRGDAGVSKEAGESAA